MHTHRKYFMDRAAYNSFPVISTFDFKRSLAVERKGEQIMISRFRKLFGKPAEVIVGCGLVRDQFSTRRTLMDNDPALSGAPVKSGRLHHALAHRRAVAGTLCIDMFAPQTEGAVIAIGALLQGLNILPAVFTDEFFLPWNEGHVYDASRRNDLVRCPTSCA